MAYVVWSGNASFNHDTNERRVNHYKYTYGQIIKECASVFDLIDLKECGQSYHALYLLVTAE